METNKIFQLTGLSVDQLADTLITNPRAYMALKGAVAEKHLHNMLDRLVQEKKIHSFRKGLGDFEKDFYIKRSSKDRELSLECKNVQVIDIQGSHTLRFAYLNFLQTNKYIEEIEEDLHLMKASRSLEILKHLPIDLRESGLPRYAFSRYLANVEGPISSGREKKYISAFKKPITIDFQRTRNSRDGEGQSNKSARFYCKDEVDLVGACLFSRTLEWDFVFCESRHFDIHPKHKNCFSSSLVIKPEHWLVDLTKVLKRI